MVFFHLGRDVEIYVGDFPSAIIQSVLHAIVCTFLIHCSVFVILGPIGAVVFDMDGLFCMLIYFVGSVISF